MKIKKTYQGAVPLNRISNQGDNSELNTYSAQYLNEKLYSFSQSQPKNNEGIWFQQGKNLFNKNEVVAGWLNEDGSIYYEETYRTSNFISVKPGVQYYKTATNSARFKFYDEDLNPLTNQYNDIANADQALAFTIPDNAHYIRFSMKIEYIHDVQVEVGDNATEYEEYIGEHLYFKNELGYKEFSNSVIVTDGIEFETGRIINGKKEYCTRLNLGPLPNATAIDYPTGLDSSYIVTHYHLYGLGSDTRCFSLPFFNLSNPSYHVLGYVKGGPSVVCTKSNYDVSAYDLIVEISYIK